MLQPLSKTDQFQQSISNAERISQQLGPEVELTFTGHSLGGGEAVANAYATGRNAITFNASGVTSFTVKPNLNSRIDAYIMFTDPINLTQNFNHGLGKIMPDVNGKTHSVMPTDKSSIFNGHSMDNMLKSFDINPEMYKLQFSVYYRQSALDNFYLPPIITPDYSK